MSSDDQIIALQKERKKGKHKKSSVSAIRYKAPSDGTG
jgi:hypothetical protein